MLLFLFERHTHVSSMLHKLMTKRHECSSLEAGSKAFFESKDLTIFTTLSHIIKIFSLTDLIFELLEFI